MAPDSFDLFCIGDTAIDLFMRIDTGLTPFGDKVCFLHGSKIPVSQFSSHIAGNVCNVSVGCSLLGLKTAIYTEVGADPSGDRLFTELEKHNVSTAFSKKLEEANTNVHVVLMKDLERTIFTYHEKRNYSFNEWPKTKWIFYSSLAVGFEKFQAQLVEHVKKTPGVGLVFNPGTIQLNSAPGTLDNVLQITDILIVNKEEALKLVGVLGDMPTLQTLHKGLLGLGPKMSVITDGENGSSAFDGTNFLEMGLYHMSEPIVDKTGAGDAYTSGFLSALFYGKSLKEAMKWGSINSSTVLRVPGSTHGLCKKEQMDQRLKG